GASDRRRRARRPRALGPGRAVRRRGVGPALPQPQQRVPRPAGAGSLPAHAGRRDGGPPAPRGGRMRFGFLLLEAGTTFGGVSGAAHGAAVGEVVFTTSMTGYQEALTDPSFHGQLLTFTAPMIGNYGVEADADESTHVQARAMLCHEARNYA